MTTTATTIGRAEAAPAALDLGSLHSVRAFAEAYRGSGRPLSVLVNNAATMLPKREVVDAWGKGEEEEEEGAMRRPVERTMAVNHLGPWLLTTLLLPTLKDTGGCTHHHSSLVIPLHVVTETDAPCTFHFLC